MTTYKITFKGGGHITGTADEILDTWGGLAYPPHTPGNWVDIKVDLAKRAWVWAGDYVDPDLDNDAFVVAIGTSRLVEGLVVDPTAAPSLTIVPDSEESA